MRKVCLLATDKTTCNSEYERHLQRYIKKHGAWASWWSFPIKDAAVPYLVKKPFYLYINEGKGLFGYRYTIVDYVSSHGNKGILSPWKTITEGGDNGMWAPSKTWFKVVEFVEIPPKFLFNFVPIEGLSKENTLICRSTFGYAFLKKGER